MAAYSELEREKMKELEADTFRNIPNFKGYQIDMFGNIRQFRNGKMYKINSFRRENRGRYVNITDSQGKRTNKGVLWLIAKAFRVKFDDETQVIGARNGNLEDTTLCNVLVTTRKKHVMNAIKTRERTVLKKCAITDQVLDIYSSSEKAAAENHFSQSQMSKRCREGNKLKHEKFYFVYEE